MRSSTPENAGPREGSSPSNGHKGEARSEQRQEGRTSTSDRDSIIGYLLTVVLISVPIGVVIWMVGTQVLDMHPLKAIQEAVGVPGVLLMGGLLGTSLAGGITYHLQFRKLRRVREERDTIDEAIDQLSQETSIAVHIDSPRNKLEEHVNAARSDELIIRDEINHSVSANQDEPDWSSDTRDAPGVSGIVNTIPTEKYPPEETTAAALVQELEAFDSGSSGSLRDALIDLGNEAADYRDTQEEVNQMCKTFGSVDGTIVIPKDPEPDDFRAGADALSSVHDELDFSQANRPDTDLRVRLRDFVDAYVRTVRNFQSYYDRMEASPSSIDLEAASQLDRAPTVNLPPNSTARRLISDLQDREDDRAMQQTLEVTVEELNAYRSVREYIEDQRTLERDVESLKDSVEDVRGPVADVFSDRVEEIDQLLSRLSGSQMDDVQQISLQERINLLEDIVSAVSELGRYQDSEVAKRVDNLRIEIDYFTNQYTNNSSWAHYNHGVPNLFLGLVEDFHSMAAGAAGMNDERARAFVDAGEEALDQIEELYQNPKFNTLLDPGK